MGGFQSRMQYRLSNKVHVLDHCYRLMRERICMNLFGQYTKENGVHVIVDVAPENLWTGNDADAVNTYAKLLQTMILNGIVIGEFQ